LKIRNPDLIEKAKAAALRVLLHNIHGPYQSLPRAAGWGYPEPYTRDLMIASLGYLSSGNSELIEAHRQVLDSLAKIQSPHGHIPSLAHDPTDLGASDTTPLFLLGLAFYRKATGDAGYLADAAQKGLDWLMVQSPEDSALVGQLPTSDWRDEQWVLGYGLYVNSLVYLCAKLYGISDWAERIGQLINREGLRRQESGVRIHEGLRVPGKPYYALWVYKVLRNDRFDLLGNSLAILSGACTNDRAAEMNAWIERQCNKLRENGTLAKDCHLPPNLFPYILPGDEDWYPRMERFNQPGDYHNGGIWPFVCGFYIAALVSSGQKKAAADGLAELAVINQKSVRKDLEFGFNEWIRAGDGSPQGQDWQTWSAAMFLYAAAAVEQGAAPFFPPIHPAE